jgi:hypothetical protein
LVQTVVLAEDAAVGGDNLALTAWKRLSVLRQILLDEVDVVAAGDETDFLALGLFGDGQFASAGQLADFSLGELAEGNSVAASCSCVSPKREVGLVLRVVAARRSS